MYKITGFLIVVIFFFGVSPGLSSADTFNFPSKKVTRKLSNSGLLTATYTDPGPNEQGVHFYRFSIRDSKNREVDGFDFQRSISGEWHDSSDGLYINNYVGSNVNDCLFLKKKKLYSLTDILITRKNSGPGIKPSETPNNSHYSLTCDGWIEKNLIKVILDGTRDDTEDLRHDFRYDFIFDTEKEKFRTSAHQSIFRSGASA